MSDLSIIQRHAKEPLAAAIAAGDAAAIGVRLDEIWAAATAAWPTVKIERGDYFRYLAERLPADAEPLAALSAVRAADLYLACGCAAGDPAAHLAFDREVLAPLGGSLGRLASPDSIDEAKQQLRARLLVEDGGGPAKIGEYAGRGRLESWVRMSAVRTLHNLHRKDRNLVPAGDELCDSFLVGEDFGLAQIKATYRDEFRAAFRAAVAALPARDRLLLKQHLLDDLCSEDLCEAYGVHRATVSRWIVKAKERLASETRRALTGRLGLRPDEVESVLRLIASRLDASVERLIDVEAEDSDPAPPTRGE